MMCNDTIMMCDNVMFTGSPAKRQEDSSGPASWNAAMDGDLEGAFSLYPRALLSPYIPDPF